MSFTRSRTLGLVAWLVLCALALRRTPAAERVFEVAFAPARVLGELALPLRLATRGSAVAAASESASTHAADVERAKQVLAAAQRAALPRDESLRRGRSLCVARVIGRPAKRADALLVRAPRGVELRVGMGAVFGDVYVGRVESVDRARPDEALVALVTGSEFRVRARVEHARRVGESDAAANGVGRRGADARSAGARENDASDVDADELDPRNADAHGAGALDANGARSDDGARSARDDAILRDESRPNGASPRHTERAASNVRGSLEDEVMPRVELDATLVAGGLAAPERGSPALHLAVRVPSDPRLASGAAVVEEPASDELGAFVRGFHLGELVAYDVAGVRTLALRSSLDYADGLSWIALVAGPEHALAGDVLAEDPFEPEAWTTARVLVTGDATPGGMAREVVLDRASDGARTHEGAATASGTAPADALPRAMRAGAAVALGAHLAGRVLAVGAATSEIALLGDPRLSFDVLAHVAGEEDPRSLGRMRCVRALRDGAIEVAWDPRVPLPSGIAREARLFTAAGERDVPPGLSIGRAMLPGGPGPFRVRIEPSTPRLADATLFRAWRGRSADEERAP